MPTLYEVTRELTQCNLDHLHKHYADEEALHGLFVRIGWLTIIAPNVECFKPAAQSGVFMPEHDLITRTAFLSPDLKLRNRAYLADDLAGTSNSKNCISDTHSVVDAGNFQYAINSGLWLGDESKQFRPVDQVERALTIELARCGLADGISVCG